MSTLFEYGCSTTNKFSFLNTSEEMEDPSEILAQLAASKDQATKDAKNAKNLATKKDSTTKVALSAKDAKKQPLQQQMDNSSKAALKTDDNKKDTRQQNKTNTNKPNNDRKPRVGDSNPAELRKGKENATNSSTSGGFGDFKQVRDQNQRRPRPDGDQQGGYRQDNRGPRRNQPGSSGFGSGDHQAGGGDKQMRARNFRHNDDNDAQNQHGDTANEERNETSNFRRRTNDNGGVRGPRGPGGGERREGGFNRNNDRNNGERREGGAGGNGGGFRQRNDPDHPRTFDRHSGSERTGIKAVDKKEGAGKSNWGTYNDELVAEGDAATENLANNDAPTGDWAARVDENEEKKDGESAADNDNENSEDVPNFMTLDQYKALKNEINKKNEFNIRRAGEGEDQTKWKNTYVLPKKTNEDEDEETDEQEEQEQEEEEDEEELKKKSLLDKIQIKFYEPASKDRGDRRDRGDRAPPRRDGDRPPRRDGDRPPPRRDGDRPPRRDEQQPADNKLDQAHDDMAAPMQNEVSPDKPMRRMQAQGERRPQGDRRTGQQQQQHRGNNSRNYQAKVNVPRIEDEKDFPSLGAK